MSKSKSGSKGAAKSAKPDVLTKVKDAAVTKPAQALKAKSRDLAKQVVEKEGKKDKKKKKVKEPTPEPSESEESDSSESSSGDDESDDEITKSEAAAKAHATGKSTIKDGDSEDSASQANGALSGSESDSESEIEAVKGKSVDKQVNGGKNGVKPSGQSTNGNADDDDDDENDESDSDESAAAVKDVAKAAVDSDASGDDSSDYSSDEDDEQSANTAVKAKVKSGSDVSSEGSDSSDEDEDEDEAENATNKPLKRKAEDEVKQTTKKNKTESETSSKGSNLFVGNLSWNVDEAWLKEVFEEFGELSGVRIITDNQSGRSKGFGYVEFVNADDAAKAHAAKAGTDLDGRTMNVDFANARPDNSQKQESRRKSYGDQTGEPSDTLFLGNLSFDVGQETVTEAFSPHGTIVGIRLPTDRETGQPRGFGYVTFSSTEEAQAALDAMQGGYIQGRPVRLDFSPARPQNNDSSSRGGRGGFGGRGASRGGRGGRGGSFGGSFGGRGGRGGRGGNRGASTTNRGGFGDFSGRKTSFD